MRIIDRFDKYMEFRGINDNQVTVNCDLSVGLIGKARKGRSDLGKKTIEKILNYYQDLNRVWLLTGDGEMLVEDEEKIDMQIRFLTLYDQLKNMGRINSDDDFCDKMGLSAALFQSIIEGTTKLDADDLSNASDEYARYAQWVVTGRNSPFVSGEFQIPGIKFNPPILRSNDGRYLIPESMWDDYMKYINGEHECQRCSDKDRIISLLEKQVAMLEEQIAELKKRDARQDESVSDADATKSAM